MVNPGTFRGSRKEFLDAQKELYAEAVAGNHVADTVADIQRRYFKRYPITLPHDQEPSEEWLAQVDDSLPDPEVVRPELGSVPPEDWDNAVMNYDALMRDLRARKDQIKRRLQYQYSKSRDESKAFERGVSDPLSVLRAKLTGGPVKKPRMKTAYNLWGPENRCFVDPIFEQRAKEGNVLPKDQAALRSAIYKEMFAELPRDEQLEWVKRAEDEHQAALKEIDRKLKAGPSTAPEDMQRIIQSMAQFMEPILDMLAEHSGWKVSLIAGGPEPADAGRLNMISIHSGVTSGSVKMNFGRSERRAYKEYIIPAFGNFLKKCYTIEECRTRALPPNHDATRLATLGEEEQLDTHRFDVDPVHANTTKPYAFKMLEVKRALDKQRREGELASQGRGQKENATASTAPASVPVKIGPPNGGKKRKLRVPPTKRAEDVRLSPAPTRPGSFTLQSASALNSASPLPLPHHSRPASSLPAPSVALPSKDAGVGPPVATNIHSDASSAPANVESGYVPFVASSGATSTSGSHVPTPDPSRTPALALSRAPTPAPSRAPTPAPSRATTPAPSRAPTPARSTAPTPAPSPAPTPMSPPASIPSAARPSRAPTPVPSRTPAPAPPQSHELTPTLPVSAQRPNPLASATNSGSSSPFVASASSSAPPLPDSTLIPRPTTSTPPGAATVPAFSTSLPSTSTRSRKRKEAEEAEEDAGPVLKKTRSSGPVEAQKRKATTSHDDGPMRKKQRGDAEITISDSAFNIAVPKGCPEWIEKAIKLVSALDFGEKWRALIAAWLKFEKKFKYKDTKLGTKSRPQVIADWLRRARPHTYRPQIKNLNAYEKDFTAWWISLQPAWRCVEDVEDVHGLQKGDGDWEVLQRSGQNGLLSVVAALFFWGFATRGNAKGRAAFHSAVDDVLYALTSMV